MAASSSSSFGRSHQEEESDQLFGIVERQNADFFRSFNIPEEDEHLFSVAIFMTDDPGEFVVISATDWRMANKVHHLPLSDIIAGLEAVKKSKTYKINMNDVVGFTVADHRVRMGVVIQERTAKEQAAEQAKVLADYIKNAALVAAYEEQHADVDDMINVLLSGKKEASLLAELKKLNKSTLYNVYSLLKRRIPCEVEMPFTKGTNKSDLVEYFVNSVFQDDAKFELATSICQNFVEGRTEEDDESDDEDGKASGEAKSDDMSEGEKSVEFDIDSDSSESEDEEEEEGEADRGPQAGAARNADEEREEESAGGSSASADGMGPPRRRSSAPPVVWEQSQLSEKDQKIANARFESLALQSLSLQADQRDFETLYKACATGKGIDKLRFVRVLESEAPIPTQIGSMPYQRILMALGFHLNFVTQVVPSQVFDIIF